MRHLARFARLAAVCLLTRATAIHHAADTENARLLTCPIESPQDLRVLHQLENEGQPIDIFEERIPIVGLDETGFVHVLTDSVTARFLMGQQGCYEQKASNIVQRLIRPAVKHTALRTGDSFHDNYRSHADMLTQLASWQKRHPSLVRLVSAGLSHEQRELQVIHITAADPGTRPLVWIMGGQHAREWIATAAVMYLVDLLLQGHASNDPAIRQLLTRYEFAILPLVNPDGYEYTRTTNRMWRKNRQRPHGVDLNRNWDFKWCEIGSSKRPTTDTYCGTSAASEPEVYQVQKYILGLPNRILGFDIHSYGQLVLRNYGWTTEPAPTEHRARPMTGEMAAHMTAIEDRIYTPMLSAGLYPTSGGADDWLYVKAGIPGFVIELRDRGESNFALSKDQIRPTGQELLAGILTALLHLPKLLPLHTFPNHPLVLEHCAESSGKTASGSKSTSTSKDSAQRRKHDHQPQSQQQ